MISDCPILRFDFFYCDSILILCLSLKLLDFEIRDFIDGIAKNTLIRFATLNYDAY